MQCIPLGGRVSSTFKELKVISKTNTPIFLRKLSETEYYNIELPLDETLRCTKVSR